MINDPLIPVIPSPDVASPVVGSGMATLGVSLAAGRPPDSGVLLPLDSTEARGIPCEVPHALTPTTPASSDSARGFGSGRDLSDHLLGVDR